MVFSSKEVKKAEAADFNDGILCVRVIDVSQLTNGAIVYMGCYHRFASGVGGNPAYTYMQEVNGEIKSC